MPPRKNFDNFEKPRHQSMSPLYIGLVSNGDLFRKLQNQQDSCKIHWVLGNNFQISNFIF